MTLTRLLRQVVPQALLLFAILCACNCGSKPQATGVCFRAHDAAPVDAAGWLSTLVTLELQQGGWYATRDCRGMQVWIPPAPDSCRAPTPADVPRPVPVGAESVIERVAPEDRRLIWLITHRFANGDGYGPLAIAHVQPNGISIESLGRLRGRSERVALELWRIRQERVVAATAESCGSRTAPAQCSRQANLLLEYAGYLIQPPVRLLDARCAGESTFELEQREEQRLQTGGQRRYEMTTTIGHDARYVVVNERISVRELDLASPNRSREIQRVDADRFIHVDRGHFLTQQWPLWSRMVPPKSSQVTAH